MPWGNLIGAIVAFGFWGLFLTLSTRHLSPMGNQVAYSVSNVIITLVAAATLRMPLTFTTTGIGWAIVSALCGITGGMFTIVSLQNSPNPGLINVVIHACPIITLGLTALFLHERITWQSGAGIVLVMSGLALIALKH